MAKRRGRNSKGPAKDKDKDKDKDPSAQQKKAENRRRHGAELGQIRAMGHGGVEIGDGAIGLETLLTFNRIKALGVTDAGQLMEAVLCSGMLELTSDDTKVRRDFEKHPIGTYDSVSRTLYIEGLPLTLGVDDLNKFFSEHGKVKLVELPQHRETREPRGFAFVEFGAAQVAHGGGKWRPVAGDAMRGGSQVVVQVDRWWVDGGGR
eukprot:Skav212650  [mRNA]  locus=scaffold1227:91951:101710:+ [translate_table: standard]